MYLDVKKKRIAPFAFLLFVFVLMVLIVSVPVAQGSSATLKWTFGLPASGWADLSSPVLADINNDSFLDIIVASDVGHITAISRDGSLIWNIDISGSIGKPASSVTIASSPAVADLDGDGTVEIVVGTGSRSGKCTGDASVIVISHLGTVEPGWPVLVGPDDQNLCAVFSSPALADLDNDGDLEIVTASFNKRILAYHHNGQSMAGFPPNSPHLQRFPIWTDQLQNKLADTIWSSPAVADIDEDGDLEIFIGTDEGNFGNRFGGVPNGYWICPYPVVATDQYCGGSTVAYSHTGEILRDSIYYILEHVQSTPAMADLNEDGVLDVVFGTGTYYDDLNSGGNSYSNRILAVDSLTGELLPGWNDVGNSSLVGLENWGGGKVTSDNTASSAAIGDIAGDSGLEVAAVTRDGRLYVWSSDGSIVSGFPMTPLQSSGNGTLGGFGVGKGVVLADTDGDGKMEILVNKAWDVVIIDGDGSQLSSRNGLPVYSAGFTLGNSPAVGDIDNDGELELVAAARSVAVWDLPGSSDRADWPMFKQNAAGTSLYERKVAVLDSGERVLVLRENGDNSALSQSFMLGNSGNLAYDWSVSSLPSGVTVSPSSGTLEAGQEQTLTVTFNNSNNIDDDFVITATDADGSPAENSPTSVDVRQIVVDQIEYSYLPFITNKQ